MLTDLEIRDFAIVEHVAIRFDRGFTVLTGETGAGKSILVDALLLALGGRADSGSIRHGADRAEITASFDLDGNAAAQAWLADQAIEADGSCLLRRLIAADGRSRAWINGQPMPIQSLRALGELLVDVHGQLEFQSLARRGYQRTLLDASTGLAAPLAAVAAAHRDWRAAASARDEIVARSRDRDTRIDLLAHYVGELDALEPRAGEAEELASERRRVASLGRLADGVAQVQALLDPDGDGAAAALGRAQSVLRQLQALDASLGPIERVVDEAAIASREAVADLARYADGLDADPARAQWLENRLAALEAAARKHRVEPGELPALHGRLRAELATLRTATESLEELERRLEQSHDRYANAARALAGARRDAAGALDARVTELMQGLGMKGGMFATAITTAEPLAVTEHGADEIEFQVSANPGQPPRPLARVASGGELSRISLALQVAALDAAHLPCLVFDEVDAGVGGAVAEMVGQQLRALAISGQVLCVTHLPQVAAQADHQIGVTKTSRGGRTSTSLSPLTGEARIEELARMLGGTTITERTRAHAREMLKRPGERPPANDPPRRLRSASRGTGSSRARNGRAG